VTSLARGPFLDSVGERAVAALRLDEVIRRWPAGSILFHEGDRADRVLLVREGRVKLVATEANGTETVLAVRGPGELLGEVAAVDGRPRSATAVAVDAVACSVVPAERFREVLETEPGAAMALLQVVAARLREAEGRRAEHGALDTVQRLGRRLLELAGTGTTVSGLNQDDLAALIGGSRESVAKALQALRSAGLVRTGRRSIELLDPDGLRRRSS
jgi:CRP/FNR family cyclic AMP-dependent transcriptional regulator